MGGNGWRPIAIHLTAVKKGERPIERIGTYIEHRKARDHRRIEILDALRGVAILAMVFYHSMFDLCDIWNISSSLNSFFSYLSYLEPFFAGLFILLAGISCRFSHNNWLRGARVLVVGLGLTLFTWAFMPSELIVFGILHFMGAAILLFALAGPLLDKIPKAVALPVWIFLFIVTFTTPNTYFIGLPHLFGFHITGWPTTSNYLFWLGIPSQDFFSADYFPLMPWFFLFLIGTMIGTSIREHRLPEKFYTAKVPFLAFVGRHTLAIYVVHQPIVYGILWLLFHFHVFG